MSATEQNNASPLESLLRTRAADGGQVSSEEHAKAIFDAFLQEYWNTDTPLEQSVLELIKQQTSARCKIQLLLVLLKYAPLSKATCTVTRIDCSSGR